MRLVVLTALFLGCSVESGGLPSGEGGVPGSDGGTCEAIAESCNGRDDDCDGVVDDGFDLDTDPLNCGGCDTACPDAANGEPICVDAECDVACAAGFDDCDGDPSNGCEASLDEGTHCGDCTTQCSGATSICDATGPTATCVDACASGELCGGSCVDTMTSRNHCGGCNMPCPDPANGSAQCVDGSCQRTCDATHGDCNGPGDGSDADGCEQPLNVPGACGACTTTCSYDRAAAQCVARTCAIGMCDVGYGNCDGDDSDGCEQPLNTLTHCAACNRECNPANATPDCSSGTCEFSCNDGYGDCDTNPATGCEEPLGTDTDCSTCGDVCGPTETCIAGACTRTCATDPSGTCVCTLSGCSTGSPCACTNGCTCALSCGTTSCSASCDGAGTDCALPAESTSIPIDFTCSGGADCEFDADFATGDVVARCAGSGTDCDLDCDNLGAAGTCMAFCTGGARCRLDCGNAAGPCAIDCGGVTPTDCGDNDYVCNRSCP